MTWLVIVIWYLIGVGSFVFWWTRDEDLTTNDVGMALLAGLIGPFAFVVGWTIHGNRRVIIRKRRSE